LLSHLSGLLAAHLRCWLDGGLHLCGLTFRRSHFFVRRQMNHIAGDQLWVNIRWTLSAVVFQPLQHSCLNKHYTERNSCVNTCRPAFYDYVRFCRQLQIIISVSWGRTVVTVRGAVEPVVHRWSWSLLRLRWSWRGVLVAVKETCRHHYHRRRREIRRNRRFHPPLRCSYTCCLLLGTPLFPLNSFGVANPISYSLDYFQPLSYFIIVPSCICYYWMHWFVL